VLAIIYLALMAGLIGLTVWRVRRVGWSYLVVPGGYATALLALFTVGDLAVAFGNHPNIWPVSAGMDPFDLRVGPLALFVGSLIPFWWAEAKTLKARMPTRQPTRIFGAVLTLISLLALATIVWRLGITSLCDYVANNYSYRLRLGSSGLTLFTLAFSLLPVGIALIVPRRLIETPALLLVALAIAAFNLFASPSKAAMAIALLAFAFATFWRSNGVPRWARSLKLVIPVGVIAAALVTLSIAAKAGDSLGAATCAVNAAVIGIGEPAPGSSPAPNSDPVKASPTLATLFESGAGRLLGYDFQTYAVITRQVAETGQFRYGTFNAAAVVNLVPRAIWADKPASPIALFRYLNGADDPSGAAIMAQGSMFIDFGVPGTILGMALAGMLFGLAGTALRGHGLSGRGLAGFAALMSVPSFVESGFLGAVPTFVGTFVVLFGCWWIARLASAKIGWIHTDTESHT
jgi:hypothetical protein